MKEGVSNEKVIISFNADSGSSNDHKPSGGDLCIYRWRKAAGEIMAVFAWLSTNKSRAEQAYQDYMDGKIDVPEADAYMGKNQKNDIEEKKNSTVKTETKKDKQSKKYQ